MPRRATTLIAIAASAAGTVLFAAPASAQNSIADRCRALPTETERFACMEGALAAIEAMRQGQPIAVPGAAPVAPPSAPQPSGLGAEQLPSARSEDRGGWLRLPRIDVPFIGGDDDDVDYADPSYAPADGLGAEQVAARNGDRVQDDRGEARVAAMIVGFSERLPGQLQFELDNGQVWRQISSDTQDLRLREGEPVAVEMWKSWAGGYRMRLVERDRMVMVERIR